MRTFTNFKTATIGTASCLALLATALFSNTAMSSPTWAKDVPTVTIENFIGTIDVRTGDYDKITVTDADGAPVELRGANVMIDGGETLNNTNCKKSNSSIKISVGNWRWNKRKGGYKNLEDYPHVTITAPENTHLVIDHAIIFGDVGNIGSADLRLRSCGDLEFADIGGKIDLSISGSGDVSLGTVGAGDIGIAGSGDFTAHDMDSLELSIAGSGDVRIADITGPVRASIAGSGDAEFGRVGGDLSFRSAGSGDLSVGNIGGNATLTTGGSGDMDIGRIDGDLVYTSGGSGDLDAEYVGGSKLSAKVGGSGSAEIDGGNVTDIYASVGGSGSIGYDGQTTNAELHANGSGSITIREPSGRLRKEKHGSGSIRIR
ncbi:MAG: DUF2807 domain-containing protein [Robiginitomaculum sp.]|nr:DUF2807 domain-containing protein [Robiginitomaculum sp.]